MTETSPTPPEPSSLPSELPTGPGPVFTFAYYFSGAALIATLVVVKALGAGLGTGITGQLALAAGSIGGTLGVLFNRTKTLEISVSGRRAWKQPLEQALTARGYTLAATEGPVSVYQKSRLRRLFAGDIYVYHHDQTVVLVSRAANIRALEKHLT